MRHKPRRLTAALVVFSLFFQLLPFPALANGGRRDLIRASAAAGALHASLEMDVSSSQSGSIQPIPPHPNRYGACGHGRHHRAGGHERRDGADEDRRNRHG